LAAGRLVDLIILPSGYLVISIWSFGAEHFNRSNNQIAKSH